MTTERISAPSAYAHKAVVYIGRFQPFHNGHLALLLRALELGEKVVVVLGSSFRSRNTKNPLTWQERAAMIRLAVPEQHRDRVHFAPVRDYYGTGTEGDERWVNAVRAGVARAIGDADRNIALIGHFKDASSYYLNHFPGWKLESVDREGDIDATHLRNVLYTTAQMDREAALAVLSAHMPNGCIAYLNAWLALPYFAQLAKEWTNIQKEKAAWSTAPYPPLFITLDSLVTCADHVLLIERRNEIGIGNGLLALPGGYLEQYETLYQGAIRELREETKLGIASEYLASYFRGTDVYDHPNRDERGRLVTHLHRFELRGDHVPEVEGRSDARVAIWVHKDKLREMEDRFFADHGHILAKELKFEFPDYAI